MDKNTKAPTEPLVMTYRDHPHVGTVFQVDIVKQSGDGYRLHSWNAVFAPNGTLYIIALYVPAVVPPAPVPAPAEPMRSR